MASRKAPARKPAPKKADKDLTPKQERFVQEYLIDLNATAAYKRAGYDAKGHAAEANAARLLRKAEVQERIAAKQQKTAAKTELSAELVLRSIVQELTFDPAKLYGADGRLLPLKDLPEDVRMALTSVEFEQLGSPDAPVYVRKVKWAQRHQAREQAMKHLGLFEQDNKQKRGIQQLPDGQLDALIAQKAKEAGVTLH